MAEVTVTVMANIGTWLTRFMLRVGLMIKKGVGDKIDDVGVAKLFGEQTTLISPRANRFSDAERTCAARSAKQNE